MMKKLMVAIGALCLVVGLAVGYGTVSAQAAEPVSVGLIVNLTGTDVKTSVELMRGVEIGVEEINASGGINGRPLKLIVEDSEYRQQAALDAATKLYEVDQVEVALMFGGSSLMIPVAKMVEQKGKLLINTSSSSPKLGEFKGTLYSLLPLDDMIGKKLGNWVAEKGVKTASVVVPNNTFGVGLMNSMIAGFEEKGGKILRKVAYTEGQPDYRADIQTVVQSNPEGIFSAGYGDDTRTIFKNARQLGLEATWYAAYPEIFVVENEKWMEGRLMGIDNAGTSLKSAKAVKAKYKAKYTENPYAHVFYGYDAIWVVALAMRQGGVSAGDIRANLMKVVETFDGATGKVKWDDRGQRINPPTDFTKFTGGKFEIVK
jgi:branched-chain amino acid transport system substrate-binding protein